jgi:hypothetical protein
VVPLTAEMKEGKAPLRTFGDLLQFYQFKQAPAKAEEPAPKPDQPAVKQEEPVVKQEQPAAEQTPAAVDDAAAKPSEEA